jgi:hypothetical protein
MRAITIIKTYDLSIPRFFESCSSSEVSLQEYAWQSRYSRYLSLHRTRSISLRDGSSMMSLCCLSFTIDWRGPPLLHCPSSRLNFSHYCLSLNLLNSTVSLLPLTGSSPQLRLQERRNQICSTYLLFLGWFMTLAVLVSLARCHYYHCMARLRE